MEREFTPSDIVRNELFESSRERLEQIAFRNIERGLIPNVDFVLTVIDVDDPEWTELADKLMPNYDWQQFRDKGEKPVARGAATASLADLISEVCPDVAPALKGTSHPSTVKTIVLGAGGVSIYLVEPKPQYRNN